MSIPKSMSTPMPEFRFTITPIKLAGTQNGVMHSNGYSQNNGSPNPVAESPLMGLHQSLSTSNGVYPDTPIARALQKVDNKSSDSDQSTSSIINEIDGESESTSSKESNQLKKSTNEEQSTSVVITEVDDESESTSAKESLSQSSLDKLRLLKKQLKTANRNNNEKKAEKIQREINALTRKSGARSKDLSENENIDGAESTPLKNKKNSSLLSPEKLKYLVETVDRNKINKIDGLIQGLKNKADQVEEKIKKLNEIVEDSEDVVGQDDYLGQIDSLRETLRKTRKRIDQLKDKSEHIERSVVPGAKTHHEIMEECKKFLENCKSEKTRALDKKFDDMVKELTEQNEQSNWTRAKIGVAGSLGFGVSFFFGNGLPRVFDMSPYIPPFISGFLHVVTATPVVKAMTPTTWSSPALAELNNNFKLRGDSWGDYWRQKIKGDSQGAQYPSTKHKGKITIEERLNEETGFWSLLGPRYKDEEASYYFYTLNYCIKAIGAALVSKALLTTSLAYKITEGVLHSICGALSGAEYLIFQQVARSNREDSKYTPTLTRKIFAAKADALRSLQKDLENTIEKYDSDPAHDESDPIHRLLIKASNKVGEDLRIATRQASMLGLLKHEFMTQFAHGNRLDTIAEILGRTLSLMPTAVVNDLTAEWRKSSDPLLVWAAHTLSGIALIMPPGFTARPLYVGFFRACLQAMCNMYENKTATEEKAAPEDKTAPEEKTAPVDDEDDDSLVGSADSSDDWIDEFFDTAWHGNPTERDENAGL